MTFHFSGVLAFLQNSFSLFATAMDSAIPNWAGAFRKPLDFPLFGSRSSEACIASLCALCTLVSALISSCLSTGVDGRLKISSCGQGMKGRANWSGNFIVHQSGQNEPNLR